MSGICGVVCLDSQSVEPRAIEAMLEPLKRRGPDGCHLISEGKAGLGQASLATTPEAQNETLPLRDSESGCVITADARLDNRNELAQRLGISPKGKGDGELILLAYHKWGRACLDHLRGDFAFAIWNPRDCTMFCARDNIGMRQLIWHHQPGKLFAFATETQSLLKHPDVPLQINEARIGDFLEDLEAKDLTSTFFEGLHKLPPAHAIIVGADRMEQWEYWCPVPQEPLTLKDDREYAEAFLDVFSDAVAVRLRSDRQIGSMLSGGMDSSSVTAVAARMLEQGGRPALKTFSAIRGDPDCVESNAIRTAVGMSNIDPHTAPLEEIDKYLNDLARLTRQSGEPFDFHMALPRVVYLAAHRAGVKVVLDGVGGDTTLGSEPMVARYLEQGRLLSAFREARGERRFWGHDADPLTEHIRSLVRALAPKGWIAKRQARYAQDKLIRAAQGSPLAPDFAARINMAERRHANAEFLAAPADYDAHRLQRIFHPHVVVARERYDRTAAALGIEPRDPFLDFRVIEFCLSLPESQLQHGGWPKIILRHATADLLPDAIRWRRGKEHLGYDYIKALEADARSAIQSGKSDFIQNFMSENQANAWLNAETQHERIEELTKLGYLAEWLRNVTSCN